MKRFFAWFFSTRSSQPPTWIGIIAWWEIRRIPYNLIVFIAGISSLLLFFLFVSLSHELKPGEDVIEPIALFAAPIAANICYTGGWVLELFLSAVRREKPSSIGPLLLKLGLGFSLVVVLLPSAVWFVIWIVKSI